MFQPVCYINILIMYSGIFEYFIVDHVIPVLAIVCHWQLENHSFVQSDECNLSGFSEMVT